MATHDKASTRTVDDVAPVDGSWTTKIDPLTGGLVQSVMWAALWNGCLCAFGIVYNLCEHPAFHSGLWVVVMGLLVEHGRVAIYEGWYAASPYATPRTVPPKTGFFREQLPHALLWVSLGTLVAPSSLSIGVWSAGDQAVLLAAWLLTDVFFYIGHRTAHHKLLYKSHHKIHHTLHAPTAWHNCERFTLPDGVSHIMYAVLTSRLLGLGGMQMVAHLSQWFVIGQWQHAGKDVDLNPMPGLAFVRRLAGVPYSLCKQHDLHHATTHFNYSMTGIPDKVFGTTAPPTGGTSCADVRR